MTDHARSGRSQRSHEGVNARGRDVALGWVDADQRRGELNVAIRTFWFDDGLIHFGTGGGITWDSTPEGEWEETELKARRLLDVTAGGAGPR